MNRTAQVLLAKDALLRHAINNATKRAIAALLTVLLVVTAVLTWAPAPASAETRYRVLAAEERDDLYSHARLGVVGGTITEQAVIKAYPEADIEIYPGDSDVIAALSGNKIDYGFVTEFYAVRFMEQNPGYEYVMPAFITFQEGFGIRKGNDELREKIDAALSQMREDGTLDAVKRKWVDERDYSMDDVPSCDDGDDVLRVALSSRDEPYTFVKDGQVTGLVVDVCRRVAAKLGMRVEFQDVDFSSEIAMVVADKADVACQLSYTEERAQQIDFTQAYVEADFGALTKDGSGETADFLDFVTTNFESTFITENRWQLVLGGLGVTAAIAGGSFALGSVLAAGLCWLRHRRNAAARAFVALYNKLATGIPVLVWLMILYYVVFASVDLTAVLVAVICFGLQAASGISGVFEAGLAATDKGQVEAGLAMGFSPRRVFRSIVLPQAAARVWPLYSAELTSLIKATSIVGYIALQDLTKVSDIIRSRTFQAFFPLIATAAVYFAIIALCGWVFSRLGRLLDPKRRKPASILKGVTAR